MGLFTGFLEKFFSCGKKTNIEIKKIRKFLFLLHLIALPIIANNIRQIRTIEVTVSNPVPPTSKDKGLRAKSPVSPFLLGDKEEGCA
ncbi:MAG TPA: hypothetical protein VKO20_00375 [Desulfosalsimonadaceae bacterium]|nr:hypothetical protein [Desulfosalsimonadaceae bacterium]